MDGRTTTQYGMVMDVDKSSSHECLETCLQSIADPMKRAQAELALAELIAGYETGQSAMVRAYDLTLEAWAVAQEVRDGQSGKHCVRVADLTVQLARAMGIQGTELVHIRRGALLHDIGKIGVPENILRKPGQLTKEEWKYMRMHPTYAYEMLQPIEYLRPALDIPYCHHEWWDGSGYPRGLKGEAIPTAARMFAVIDVWDAIRTDRVYRKASTDDIANHYLTEQSDKQFDRSIVDIFLAMDITAPPEVSAS